MKPSPRLRRGRKVWIVGGGDLASQFADIWPVGRGHRLDRAAPVTLGAGAPLLPRHIELRLDELGRNGDLACATFTSWTRRPRFGRSFQDLDLPRDAIETFIFRGPLVMIAP